MGERDRVLYLMKTSSETLPSPNAAPQRRPLVRPRGEQAKQRHASEDSGHHVRIWGAGEARELARPLVRPAELPRQLRAEAVDGTNTTGLLGA